MAKPEEELSVSLTPALSFLQRLWRLNHALERLSGHMERRLGVTAQQRLILRCVGTLPGSSPGQLARLLHVDPGTVSASLSRLEEKGLITRRRDTEDKRRSYIHLTTNGSRATALTSGTVEHAVEQLLSKLGKAQITTAKNVIDSLSSILETEVESEP